MAHANALMDAWVADDRTAAVRSVLEAAKKESLGATQVTEELARFEKWLGDPIKIPGGDIGGSVTVTRSDAIDRSRGLYGANVFNVIERATAGTPWHGRVRVETDKDGKAHLALVLGQDQRRQLAAMQTYSMLSKAARAMIAAQQKGG